MPNVNRQGKGSSALLAFIAGIVFLFCVSYTVKATDGPGFCASCHSMNDVAWTHKQSVHGQFDCNECHTPAALGAKLPFKAKVGMQDLLATVTAGIPNVIHSSKDMKNVIQANCRRCHLGSTMGVAMDVKPYCTDCHRTVPHNRLMPIDKRKAADA
ncbi:MAG: NapC/NirT family cytochrome c [Desulfovibrio sp.]|jgi:cytochrome c nitrite reductase small subunit|nr:NapC/NirT family cytochrome c [Desulfovibrio sp.]